MFGSGSFSFGVRLDVLIAVMLAMFSYGAVAAVVLTIFTTSNLIIAHRMVSKHPDLTIVDELLGILSLVEREAHLWEESGFSSIVSLRLEEVARSMLYYLPRYVRTGDAVTDAWFADTANQMAAAMRALKKWAVTPKPDTCERFIEQIVGSFVHAASGNWDCMQRAEPGKLTPSKRLHNALAVSRTILLAFLPLVLLEIAQQTPVAPRGDIAEYLKAGFIIWAALTLLVALDPLFSAKLTALKEAVQLLPFWGSKK